MKDIIKKYSFLTKTVIIIGITVLIYITSDVPRRTTLKESLSILTIVSFVFLLSQFFLSRAYRVINKNSKMSIVVKAHKFIGCLFTTVIFLHPIFIVFPRYFEGGVEPVDAFVTIITTLDSTGIVLGIIAWFLMVILGITSFFRYKLFKNYRTWRLVHGVLSIFFAAIASGHVIELGRHSIFTMSIFIIIITTMGTTLLLNTYLNKDLKIRVVSNERKNRKEYNGQKKVHNLSW